MAEELGKIEKPAAEEYKEGRKLYFVPLIYLGGDSPEDYQKLAQKYWEQVESQIAELEAKLGAVQHIFHELIPATGEGALKTIEELCDKSCQIIKDCIKRGAQLEAVEDSDILTEFMDWSKCLLIGLQNQNVVNKVYDAYLESSRKRNEYIIKKIDETIKKDEIGILIMRESHQLQFPTDIQIIYVAPPALDEINRWLRDRETKEDN
jgi:hypothetical protein